MMYFLRGRTVINSCTQRSITRGAGVATVVLAGRAGKFSKSFFQE